MDELNSHAANTSRFRFMRFSLSSLMTLTTVSAWFLALTQIPVGYRGEFIGATLILLASAMFAIAMTCRKNESDSLDYENNMLLDALGPTFVVAAFIVAVSTVGFLAFVVYSILTF